MVTTDRLRAMLLLSMLYLGGMAVYPLDTLSGVFSRDVRTLSVENPDYFMSPPVVRLGTSDRLVVKFDILGDEHQYLRYRILHCNADWQPSRLLEPEYVGGFNECDITDYAYSSGTYVHYVNYRVEIPNEDMQLLVSGNYLMQVYPESEPDEILLQQRFCVSENSVAIAGNVTARTDRGVNDRWQQLYITVDVGDGSRINPYQDLVVTVTQNNRPETTRTLAGPLRTEGGTIVYAHDPALVFNAGDEYRRFETVRADYAGMHTDSVKFGGSNWHAYLSVDEPREEKDYIYDETQHGRFKIDEYNSSNPDLGADYVTVHFTLEMPRIAEPVYVDGDFTSHRFGDFNRMRYDDVRQCYVAEIPLKQGSYNYQYVVDRGGVYTPAPIDGDKYETRNEYLVKVYLRQPGSRGDRLVGATVL